ncbi:MAG: hypothetical protein JJE28_00950 [Actinomycetales bacterium]|nr:hypothetical protein [Actinomycetales bacterium]
MSNGKIRGALNKMKTGAGNLVSVDTPQRGNRFDRLTEYFENHPVARYVVPIVVLLLAGTAVFFWTASIREGQQSVPEGFSVATPSATGKESDGSLGQAPGGKYELPMEGKLLEANQIAPNAATGEIVLPQTQDLLVFSGAFARVGFSMTETASFQPWYVNMKSYYMPFTDMTGSGWSEDGAHPGLDDTPQWASDFSSPGRPALVLNKTSTVVGIWADKELYDFQVNLEIGADTPGGEGTHLVRVALENTTTLFDGRTTTDNVTLEMVVACSPWVGTEEGCRGFSKGELAASSYSNSNAGFWVYVNTDRYPQPIHTD